MKATFTAPRKRAAMQDQNSKRYYFSRLITPGNSETNRKTVESGKREEGDRKWGKTGQNGWAFPPWCMLKSPAHMGEYTLATWNLEDSKSTLFLLNQQVTSPAYFWIKLGVYSAYIQKFPCPLENLIVAFGFDSSHAANAIFMRLCQQSRN